MANNQEYIDRVKLAVEQLHHCVAVHSATVPVQEVSTGQKAWKGDIEIFDLNGNTQAKRAYAWSEKSAKAERFFVILETPAIQSAIDAFRALAAADAKKCKDD